MKRVGIARVVSKNFVINIRSSIKLASLMKIERGSQVWRVTLRGHARHQDPIPSISDKEAYPEPIDLALAPQR
jgi:hypothetical protein